MPAALQDSTFDTSGPGTFSFGTLTAATFAGLQGTGDLTLSNAASPPAGVALAVGDNGTTTTFSGQLAGDGSLTMDAPGELILSGDNSGFSGSHDGRRRHPRGGVAGGVADGNRLRIGGQRRHPGGRRRSAGTKRESIRSWAAATLPAARIWASTRELEPVPYDDTALASSMGLVVLGSGTLVLTGSNNTYSGGTAVLAATLQFRSTSCLAAKRGNNPGRRHAAGDGWSPFIRADRPEPGRRHDRHQRLPRDGGFAHVGERRIDRHRQQRRRQRHAGPGADNDSTGGVDIESATVQLAGADALGSGNLTVNGTLDLAGYSVQVASLAGADVTIIDSSGGRTLQLESDSTLGDLAQRRHARSRRERPYGRSAERQHLLRPDHQQFHDAKHVDHRSGHRRGTTTAAFRTAAAGCASIYPAAAY